MTLDEQIALPLAEAEPIRRRTGREARPRHRANRLDGTTWTRNSISIWSDIRKAPEEIALNHPAMFPIALAARLIQCYLPPTDSVVLDPFVGSGSTAIAAEALGIHGIGIDLSERYVELARRRPIPQPELINGGSAALVGTRIIYRADARELLSLIERDSVDLVVTSPPYWDILLQDRTADYKSVRNYGEDESDVGRIPNYDSFLDALARIFAQVYEVMRPGKYCCVNVMDIRKKNRFYPLHSDLATRLQDVGFMFDDIIIWDRRQEYNNMRPLGYPSVFRINKAHEYILILQKPA